MQVKGVWDVTKRMRKTFSPSKNEEINIQKLKS